MSYLMFYDPLQDADYKDRKEQEWLDSRPVCSICGEPIQEEYAYNYKGEWICEGCIDDMREYID